MAEKKLVIFCSSSYDIDPKYNAAAREVVRSAVQKGYTIVSGGAVKGTMGAVSKAVTEFGGRHVGVLPRFMSQFHYPDLSDTVWTDTMSERKEKMREGCQVAIALPGGIGTMDELFETQVLAKLGKFSGKILALNLDGFYEPLKALLDKFVETRMTAKVDCDRIQFYDTVEELVKHI